MPVVGIKDEHGNVHGFPIKGEKPTNKEMAMIRAAMKQQAAEQWRPSKTDRPREPYGTPLSSLIPRNIEDLRPAFEGGGAMGGALLALPSAAATGPVGPVAGAVMGSAAGQGAFDLTAQLGRDLGLVGPEGLLRDSPNVGASGGVLGPTRRMLESGAFEAVMPGMTGPYRASKRLALQKIAGIRDAGQRVMAHARELGVPLGIEPLSGRPFLQGYRRIFTKFPWLGKPLQDSDRAVAAALKQSKDALIHEVAPVAQTVIEAGIDLGGRALRRTRAMSRHFSQRYEKLLDAAEASGARVPTDSTRAVASDLVDEFTSGLPKKNVKIKLEDGGATTKQVPIKVPNNQRIIRFAQKELMNLTEDMSPRQYQRLGRILNGLLGEVKDNKELFRQAVILRRALEKDFDDIVGDDAIVGGLRALNKEFHSYALLLKRPTGKRIVKATRGVFTMEGIESAEADVDTLFRRVYDAGSPGAISDLRRLVGPVPFKRAVRTHIDEAFDRAINLQRAPVAPRGYFGDTDPVFDLNVVRNELGLTKMRSPRRAALKRALQESGTGITIGDWDKWFDVAEAHFRMGEIRVSDFIARRAQFTGLRGIARTIIPGASVAGAGGGAGALGGMGVGGGVATGVAVLWASRKFGRFLTEPAMLKAATSALDTSLTPATRSAFAQRFLRLMAQERFRGRGDSTLPGVDFVPERDLPPHYRQTGGQR